MFLIEIIVVMKYSLIHLLGLIEITKYGHNILLKKVL